MTRIHLYIFRQLFGMFVFVTLSCVVVGVLARGLGIILDAVSHGFPILSAAYGLLVLMPGIFLVVVPFALLVAIVHIYDKLAQDLELLSMRIGGVSGFSLAQPALGLGLVAAALSFGSAIWLLPASKAAWLDLKALRNAAPFNVSFEPGRPHTLTSGLTILARARSRDRTLLGAIVQDNRDPRQSVTILAQSGVLVVKRGRLVIRFADGSVHKRDRTSGEYLETATFQHLNYVLPLASLSALNGGTHRAYSIAELLHPPEVFRPGSVDYRKMLADGHMRLSASAACISIALLVLAILFFGRDDRQSRRRRVVACAAVTTGIVLTHYALQQIAKQYSAALPLLYLNVLIPGVIAVWLLRSRRLFQS